MEQRVQTLRPLGRERGLARHDGALRRGCRHGKCADRCYGGTRSFWCSGEGGDQAEEALGRSKGGFTTKIHAATDALGNPVKLTLTGGNRHDVTQAEELLDGWSEEQVGQIERVIADKGYDSDAVIETIKAMQAEAVIPPKANRLEQREYDQDFYKERHLVECFFNKLKQFRRVFSRFEQTARNFLAFAHFASTMILLR